MERKELENLFCEKIGMELECFKSRILRMGTDEIYGRAYQIDCMVTIYELLLEMCEGIESATLKLLVPFPGLLSYLYRRWMKEEDSRQEEMKSCLEGAMLAMCRAYHEVEMTERGAAA